MRTSIRSITCALLGALLAGAGLAAHAASKSADARVLVYWDQNEEEDVLVAGQVKQLVPPYDPNGQMCIFPDHSGRFVTGYNPTLPSQDNPGSLKPLMNPPVGEAVWDRHGSFTGQTIYVPGPYALPGSTIGGDIPPDSAAGGFENGAYNNNGTFTGCAFDHEGHLFAADIGTAQGQIPVPDDGRIIEWFPPDYTQYCIIYGPDVGGVGPHHVDGSGGLRDPGTLAVRHGDLYVPETGAGRVLRFRHRSFPRRAADCGPDGLLAPKAQFDVLLHGTPAFPIGIAWDPRAHAWAVSTVIGDPAVAWFNDDGTPHPAKGPVPAGPYNPFGIAVAPSGDLYFVDIHVVCDASGCGPADNGGGVFEVAFHHGVPLAPQRIAGGLNFPTSVTVCRGRDCPTPP